MSTGEGEDPRGERSRRDGEQRRGEHIGVGGGDDSVTRIQLAARWAEAYAGEGDSLGGALRRFRAAYEYLDAVIHGVEPAELDSVASEARAGAAPGSSGPSSNL
jgi:hypothetical protein